jgi:multimeric flavodoxin WrbA
MKASSTYHMLKPLLEGMEEAGAETELIHIRELKLEVCIGCYICWVRTPGECIHNDKPLRRSTANSVSSSTLRRTMPIRSGDCVPDSTAS